VCRVAPASASDKSALCGKIPAGPGGPADGERGNGYACARINPPSRCCGAAKSCFILIEGLIDTGGTSPPSG